MKRVYYNKIIRDAVADKIRNKGEVCEVREIEREEEYVAELKKKIVEEARELSETSSREAFLSEYADLMVALDALTAVQEFSEADIRTALSENVAKKGLFKKRLFLNWSQEQ